jgi:cytochrome c oxidase subunit 3
MRGLSEKTATIHADDVESWSNFVPKHSPFLAIYYAITGLHGLHILGGLVMFVYFFFFSEQLYRRNPEHMANRIEVVGLYWHFVDLVWIFVFPVFYLL